MRRALKAIARREIGAFLRSAVSPVVVTAFLLLVGYSFVNILLEYDGISRSVLGSGKSVTDALGLTAGVLQPLFNGIGVFLMFVMPAVTMRLFSEEYRSGRYDLIMTYPVEEPVWVLGKTAAAWLVGLGLLAATLMYLLVVATLAVPDPGPLIAAALGLTLLTAMMASWGVFFSSLQQYQVVSYILTFAFLSLLFAAGNLEPFVPGALAPLVDGLSLPRHFERFTRGVIDTRDVIYLVSWTALGVACAIAALSGRRLAGARRAARWTTPLLLAALLAVLGVVASRAPGKWDLTSDRANSLAPQTERVLANLNEDVTVTAFYQRLDPNRKVFQNLLEAFQDRLPSLRWEMVDPDASPGRVEDMGVTTARAVVVASGGRVRRLLDPDEAALINAIYRVVTDTRPVIYEIAGHGERALDDEDRGGFSAYEKAVRDDGYLLRPLVLPESPTVPDDARVVVIAGPRTEFADAELEGLSRYLDRGGSLLLMLDPGPPASLTRWLRRFNVEPKGDFLVSSARANKELRVDDRVTILFEYGPHEITRGLTGMATLFPFAQPLAPVAERRAGIDAHTVLLSDRQSWEETDLAQVRDGKLSYDEGQDVPGPLPFGVAIEIDCAQVFGSASDVEEPEARAGTGVAESLHRFHQAGDDAGPTSVFSHESNARLVVYGDTDFAANAFINLYGNRDLLLNTLSWLAREPVLIAPRAKPRGEPLVLTSTQRRFVGWGAAAAWPALVGMAATILVVRRRRHL